MSENPGLDRLVGALGEYPGLEVRQAEGEGDRWVVDFVLAQSDENSPPSQEVWFHFELLAWTVRDQRRAGRDIRLTVEALPPYFNPYPMLWALEGYLDPGEYADLVGRARLALQELEFWADEQGDDE